MYNSRLKEQIIEISRTMKNAATTDFYSNVENHGCREVCVEIKLIDGTKLKLLNCALESLKEQTYKGVNIEIIWDSLVEITGKNNKHEYCQYIPIDRIISISLTVLSYVKWDEKTQTISCDNAVYCITDILPLNKRFH